MIEKPDGLLSFEEEGGCYGQESTTGSWRLKSPGCNKKKKADVLAVTENGK